MKKPSGPEVACTFAKSSGGAGQGSAPIISVPTQTRASQNGLEHESAATSCTDQPIFFRCVSVWAPLFVIYSHNLLILLDSQSISQSFLMMIYMLVYAFLFQRVQVHFWGANPTRLSWETHGHGAGVLFFFLCQPFMVPLLWNCFRWVYFSGLYDFTYIEHIL